MTGALTRERAAKVANITYTQIVWALIWDKVLWNNWPDIWSVLGGGLIIGSAIWVAMKKDVTVATVNDIAEVVPSTPEVEEYRVEERGYNSPDEEQGVEMPLTPISKRESKVTIKRTGEENDLLEEEDKSVKGGLRVME